MHPDLIEQLDLRDVLLAGSSFGAWIAMELAVKTTQRFSHLVLLDPVGHFVKEGTALDGAAFQRATSTYLVDRVIPMLPERLSGDLCSLRPDEERLTFSCVLDLDADGKVHAYRIVPSVIRSAACVNSKA